MSLQAGILKIQAEMSVLIETGTETEEDIGDLVTAIAWEKIGNTLIPFIRKTNGQMLTSKHLLKDVLFKQEFGILKDEIFELICSPNLHQYNATKLENRLLNEISNENLKISLTDRPVFLILFEDAYQVYTILKNVHIMVTERRFPNPLYGYLYMEKHSTPIPFLSVKNVGVVVPTCFFECPELLQQMFSVTYHWDAVYFKLLFKLLKIRDTFLDNIVVVKLGSILSGYPSECRSYTVAQQLPPIVDVSEFTVYDDRDDDDIIIVENQPDPIEILSSDDESTGPQEPQTVAVSQPMKDEQNAEISHENTKDKHQPTNQEKSLALLPQVAISTNQEQLDLDDTVDILDIIPNKNLPNQEFLKLTNNPVGDADLRYHKVHKIIANNNQATYNIGIQRFKDIKYEFICINTRQPPSKKVYLINLSEILEVMFPRAKVERFMQSCNKFSLKTFALDTSHIKYLTMYYANRNREPPKDYFYLELRKFCEVYWGLKRIVEE